MYGHAKKVIPRTANYRQSKVTEKRVGLDKSMVTIRFLQSLSYGLSINDVTSFFQFLDPFPSPFHFNYALKITISLAPYYFL